VVFEALPNGNVNIPGGLNIDGGQAVRSYTSGGGGGARAWKKLFKVTMPGAAGGRRHFYEKIVVGIHTAPDRTLTGFIAIAASTSTTDAYLRGALYYISGPSGVVDVRLGYTGTVSLGTELTIWIEASSYGYIHSFENIKILDEAWTNTDPNMTYFPLRRLLDENGAAITATTASTSPTTGALTVAGGVGIAGAVVAGALNAVGSAKIGGFLIVDNGATISGTLYSANQTNVNELSVVGKAYFSGDTTIIGSLKDSTVRMLDIVSQHARIQTMLNSQLWYYGNYPGSQIFVDFIARVRQCYLWGNQRIAVRGAIGGTAGASGGPLIVSHLSLSTDENSIIFYGVIGNSLGSCTINASTSTSYAVSLMFI
jgi:hypothetical protein